MSSKTCSVPASGSASTAQVGDEVVRLLGLV